MEKYIEGNHEEYIEHYNFLMSDWDGIKAADLKSAQTYKDYVDQQEVNLTKDHRAELLQAVERNINWEILPNEEIREILKGYAKWRMDIAVQLPWWVRTLGISSVRGLENFVGWPLTDHDDEHLHLLAQKMVALHPEKTAIVIHQLAIPERYYPGVDLLLDEIGELGQQMFGNEKPSTISLLKFWLLRIPRKLLGQKSGEN